MQKVIEEELKEIQELCESLLVIVSTVGELYLAKTLLEKEIAQVETNIKNEEQKFTEFQQKERVIYDKLQQKYGTGNINLDTGEITV